MDKTGIKVSSYFCVEAINCKKKIRGKLGHMVQIHVYRLV